ncbi:uncharacterized protein LOC131942945 [Physella acuta]|uniref:uncharacterized protein LOC131942945 n=1 Tax=Physella acuta TaxID=109671 RepID=UPI0027DE2C7D|nr:uncharacterized protein LOC131942945 [Physella acuta]
MGNSMICAPGIERRAKVKAEKKRYQTILQLREQKVLEDHGDEEENNTTETDQTDSSTGTPLRRRAIKHALSVDPVDQLAEKVRPEEYQFPFENLIFEGGGNKGLAYVGCIRYLEELGMMGQIRRIGGSSAGAITAALVAVGYDSRDIETFLSDNIEEVFIDHSCGYLSLLPNLLSKFGWNPGKRIFNWFGDRIKEKSETKNPDMTFYDLYKEKQMELCVVVTNLNQMRAEYCHPKTTPDMPIREALRMSMAIPGVFTARVYDNHGQFDTYVDGGVLCNYPIHCYDGWYLSMAKEDAFLQRMKSLKDLPFTMSQRFEPPNNKTIGFLLYDDTEMEVLRYSLEKRVGSTDPYKISKDTKLSKLKDKKKTLLKKAEREHSRMVKAVEAFMKVLDKHNLQEQEFIDKTELENALNDTENFSEENAKLLFGEDIDVNTAFNILDKDGNGRIAFLELVQFIEEHGIRMQTRFQGFGRRDVNTFFDFLSALQNTLLTNLKYVFVNERDEYRTVGINTGHVGTSDYVLEDADREFVVERGYNATKAFLKYYVANNPDCEKRSDPVKSAHKYLTNSSTIREVDEIETIIQEKEPASEKTAH